MLYVTQVDREAGSTLGTAKYTNSHTHTEADLETHIRLPKYITWPHVRSFTSYCLACRVWVLRMFARARVCFVVNAYAIKSRTLQKHLYYFIYEFSVSLSLLLIEQRCGRIWTMFWVLKIKNIHICSCITAHDDTQWTPALSLALSIFCVEWAICDVCVVNLTLKNVYWILVHHTIHIL